MGIIINDKTYSTLCRQGRRIRSAKNNRDKLYESITEDIIKMYGNTLSKTYSDIARPACLAPWKIAFFSAGVTLSCNCSDLSILDFITHS